MWPLIVSYYPQVLGLFRETETQSYHKAPVSSTFGKDKTGVFCGFKMVPPVLLWNVIPPVRCYSCSANSCAKTSDTVCLLAEVKREFGDSECVLHATKFAQSP